MYSMSDQIKLKQKKYDIFQMICMLVDELGDDLNKIVDMICKRYKEFNKEDILKIYDDGLSGKLKV